MKIRTIILIASLVILALYCLSVFYVSWTSAYMSRLHQADKSTVESSEVKRLIIARNISGIIFIIIMISLYFLTK